MNVTPSALLAELMAQHEELRTMMDRCEELAGALDAGAGDPLALTREVAKLRLAFDVHNRFEERLLRPVLREIDAFGEVRIERMFDGHVSEHRAMRAQLGCDATNSLREAIDCLRAHLREEERYFLSSRILRDDVVTLESGS